MQQKLRLLFLMLILGLVRGLPAGAQIFEWARLIRNVNTNSTDRQGATTDPAGNTYAVGMGTDSERPVVKYDSTGRQVWTTLTRNVRFFVDGGVSRNLTGIQADPVGGGFFVVGELEANATWGGVPVPGAPTAAGVQLGFYGKCAADGRLSWARPFLIKAHYQPALAVDGLGNCYLAGGCAFGRRDDKNFVGSMGGKAIDSTTAFLVGNNGAGTAEWVRRIRATPSPRTGGLVFYGSASGIFAMLKLGPRAAGGCLLFGTYNEMLTLENAAGTFVPVLRSLTPAGSGEWENFMTSLTPAGDLSWVRRTPAAPSNLEPTDVNAAAADAAGNYYLTGSTGFYQGSRLSTAKYGPAGNLTWVSTQQAGAAAGSGTGRYIVVDQAGEATIVASVGSSGATLGKLTLTGNYNDRDNYSLVHFDAAGVAVWATGVRSGRADTRQTYSYCEVQSLGMDAKGNLYYAISPSTASNISSPATGYNAPEPPVTLVGENTLVGSGVLVARLGTRHNTVQGRVYLDANGNGRRDAGEGAFPETLVLQAVQPTDARLGTLDAAGRFSLYAGRGAYSLAPPSTPLHYVLSEPASGAPYTGNFSGFGGVDTARTFGFRPLVSQTDLRATLTPYGAARPGFNARYRLTLANVGTTTVPAGTATLTLDERAQAVSSSVPAAAVSGRTVSLPYSILPVFGRAELDVLFRLPTDTPLGTVLRSTAAAPLAADVVPADNEAIAVQTVTGSLDPNDIEVNYQRLTPAQLVAGQPLDYTVRFQNMGTDTAFTVVLKDTLDASKLNLRTLQLVAQSHNCRWSLDGAGQLTVRFLDIRLPHRGVDVIRSQGFARFRVQPHPTLSLGTIIPNRASIVFDYNAPVRTNQAITAVLLPTALAASHEALAWRLYPNPARDEQLTVAAELPGAGRVRLDLLDALGRPVRRQSFQAPAGFISHLLDLRGVTPGLYLLRLQLPDGTMYTQRLVRE